MELDGGRMYCTTEKATNETRFGSTTKKVHPISSTFALCFTALLTLQEQVAPQRNVADYVGTEIR